MNEVGSLKNFHKNMVPMFQTNKKEKLQLQNDTKRQLWCGYAQTLSLSNRPFRLSWVEFFCCIVFKLKKNQRKCSFNLHEKTLIIIKIVNIK